MQNSDQTRITVAIPTHNGARHLAETLRSVLAQGPAYPLILCDDRSDDETLAIARTIAGDRLQIVVNSERAGLAGNWNRCLSLAETPLVAIVHQDDVLRPLHLVKHERFFAQNDQIGLIASATSTIDELGREVPASVVDRGGLGAIDRVFSSEEAVKAMAESNPLRCSAVTIVRSVYERVGGFDASYRYVVDWEYWLRLAKSFGIGWIAEPTVDVRWHQESETHRFANGTADLDETMKLQDALFANAKSPELQAIRTRANRRLARAFLNRAYVSSKAGNTVLARKALSRAISLRPAILGRIAIDPRLAARMAGLFVRA
jgi:glycosyltransferase involved in cell wall biosynthesis